MLKKLILLAGPTASGKSKLAIKLAKKLNGEIINADSMQVFKEFTVLSSRPNLKQTLEIKEYDNNITQDAFIEIIPLNEGIETEKRKEVSSIPISNFNLPDTVYMIVDKKIEIEPKILKEYTDWNFLPEKDLSRLTLEIFSEQKKAKIFCSKNQKIIKIPNSKILSIVSRFLIAKGITRIIYKDNLLSL